MEYWVKYVVKQPDIKELQRPGWHTKVCTPTAIAGKYTLSKK